MSLAIAFAQAEPAYEGNKEVCTSSDFINKTHLSCIACGLKKAGRPVPDDHYLALMGLLVRENTSLFPDEKNPKFNKTTQRGDRRRSINGRSSQIVETKDGPVELTAKAQMQKNTIQLMLASGYCAQGKVKPKVKGKNNENTYANFVDRMNSDEAPVTGEVKKKRNLAAKELGQSDWDNAKDEFLYDVEGSSFFTLPFEQQQEFYKKRRSSTSGHSDEGYRPRSEISDCLADIEQNYTPKYSSSSDAYTACTAIYDECGIATNPNDNDNTIRNGKRVGGDWCGTIYKKAASPPKGNPTSGLREDGTPPAPIVDKSFRSLGEVFQQGDNIVGPEGTIDMSKVIKNPDGSITIPKNAIKLKQPASLPTVQTQPPPNVEVRGQQRNSPPPK